MKRFFLIALAIISLDTNAQATDSLPEVQRTIKVTDPFYREDQFYIGLTHSILLQDLPGFSQQSLALGSSFGFLRDIPVNKQRTMAIAPGFGFAMYNLRHNLALIDSETNDFYIDEHLTRNVQKATYLEIPIEFRWRTSKVHSHKFWRIYTGVKYSYLLNSSTKYQGYFGEINYKKNSLVSKSNLGIYVSAGFNTWNFYAYYGFTPLYKKGTADADRGHLNMLNLGLMFYIL
ncbi:MAG TPA: porin family protein [Flavobacterium sp.]|nr:porin family protein [Flavobacterium sp.]